MLSGNADGVEGLCSRIRTFVPSEACAMDDVVFAVRHGWSFFHAETLECQICRRSTNIKDSGTSNHAQFCFWKHCQVDDKVFSSLFNPRYVGDRLKTFATVHCPPVSSPSPLDPCLILSLSGWSISDGLIQCGVCARTLLPLKPRRRNSIFEIGVQVKPILALATERKPHVIGLNPISEHRRYCPWRDQSLTELILNYHMYLQLS